MTYPSLCICSHFGFFILARTRVETEKACLICMICCPINAGLFPPVLCEHGDTESMACLQPLTVLLPARAHSHDPGSPFCLQLPDHVYKNKQKKKYPAPVLNAAEMFSWRHFSLSTNCLSLKCCVVIPIPKRRGLLLRMGERNAQENNLFEDVSPGFMNDDSLSYLSSKVQFRWYDNAENVLSPWGGSCFSGGVLLFPHYCNAVPEALCQSCCAAACECWG